MNENNIKEWFVYIIRCCDNSLYTGITTDVKRRYNEHISGKGAKYTRVKKPIEICAIFKVENRSIAGKLEYFIKNLSKKEKEILILNEESKKIFGKYIEEKLKIKINL